MQSSALFPRTPRSNQPHVVILLNLLCAAATITSPAAALPPPEAEILFQEGMRLIAAGKADAACPKLEASQRIDPALGTEFHLAECYEAVGRHATAWSTFLDVAARARASNMLEQERKARIRATAIEPNLSKLTLIVPNALARTPGLVLKRDGTTIEPPLFNIPIPIDPGEHVIQASAPGKEPWERRHETRGPGVTVEIEVPFLNDLPPSPAASPFLPNVDHRMMALTPPPSHDFSQSRDTEGNAQRAFAFGLGGLGLVGLGVGGTFAALAINKNEDWKNQTAAHCNGQLDCTSSTIDSIRQIETDRNRFATISTIGFITGGAALLGAAIVWITAPSHSVPTRNVRLSPLLDKGAWGTTLRGSF